MSKLCIVKHRHNGFTLVELAIALMVIGLLIGGVLKGQELIENAKVTATIRQIKAYDAAAMIFRNTYNALPGDIKRPNRIPNCTATVCVTVGNGNGLIERGVAQEQNNFFPHLTKAGMITGPTGDDYQWTSQEYSEYYYPRCVLDERCVIVVENGHWGITSSQNENIYQVVMITGRAAQSLDMKLDDGYVNRGDIVAIRYSSQGDSINPSALGEPLSYNIAEQRYDLLIPAGF